MPAIRVHMGPAGLAKNTEENKSLNPATRRFWNPWRIVGTLLAAAVVTVVAFLGWQYWLMNGGIFRTSRFDETEWKSLRKFTTDSSCYRGGMAQDIKTKVLRTGMTRAEVEKLLGPPDLVRDEYHEYLLGMCSGLRIDFDTLDVHFDSGGRLAKVQTVQH